MKKLGAMLAACLLGFSLTACENPPAAHTGSVPELPDSGSSSAATDPQPSSGSSSGSSADSADPNMHSFGDCSITVLGYSLRQDADGSAAIRVEYLFTNNSIAAASFSTSVIPSAYQQEGCSLAYTTPAERDPAHTALLTLVDPGESITCAGYFKLEDVETPVTLEIKDLRSSSAGTLSRTLEIAALQQETTEGSASPAA